MKKERNFYIWAVAGLYLIYLGVRQAIALLKGTASIPALSAVSGLVFLAVGVAVLLREWRGYRRRYYGADGEEETEETESPEETGEEEERP